MGGGLEPSSLISGGAPFICPPPPSKNIFLHHCNITTNYMLVEVGATTVLSSRCIHNTTIPTRLGCKADQVPNPTSLRIHTQNLVKAKKKKKLGGGAKMGGGGGSTRNRGDRATAPPPPHTPL